MRHVWSLLCRSSAIHKDLNNLSIFDTFEEVTLLAPILEPAVLPLNFQMVTLWARTDLGTPEG